LQWRETHYAFRVIVRQHVIKTKNRPRPIFQELDVQGKTPGTLAQNMLQR